MLPASRAESGFGERRQLDRPGIAWALDQIAALRQQAEAVLPPALAAGPDAVRQQENIRTANTRSRPLSLNNTSPAQTNGGRHSTRQQRPTRFTTLCTAGSGTVRRATRVPLKEANNGHLVSPVTDHGRPLVKAGTRYRHGIPKLLTSTAVFGVKNLVTSGCSLPSTPTTPTRRPAGGRWPASVPRSPAPSDAPTNSPSAPSPGRPTRHPS